MKFIVTRTSVLDTVRPCEGTSEVTLPSSMGSEYPNALRWTIDIDDLEQLQAFVKTHGSLIVTESDYSIPLEIEIYDDYRE